MTSTQIEKAAFRISSSEIAPLLGISPFRTRWQVWAAKKGIIEDEAPSEKMLWGILHEPAIAEEFARRMQLEVERHDQSERIFHVCRPWQGATPDYWIRGEPRQILECKTAYFPHDREWSRIPTAEGVPRYYVAQVQWQLSTTGLKSAYVAVLLNGWDFRIYHIDSDPLLEKIELRAAEEFREKYLLGDQQPEIDESPAADEYLSQRFPREREDMRFPTPEEKDRIESYRRIRHLQKRVVKRRRQLEHQLTQAIGDHAGLEWDEGKLTWKRTRDSWEVNWKGLAENQLEGLDPDQKRAKIDEFSQTKWGYRRIYFRDTRDEEEEDA